MKKKATRDATTEEHQRMVRSQRLHGMVQKVVKHHFGEKPKKLQARAGGLTNAVWTFRVSQGDFVFRTHDDPGKFADYLKEQWAMDAARAVGVPTPRVLEVGNVESGHPYMITEQMRGTPGDAVKNRCAVLERLGQLAALTHGVRTNGYGPVFDWSGNRLSRFESWRAWLTEGFDVEGRLRTLVQNGLLDDRQVATLRKTTTTMLAWRKPPVLHHGDLRLKNTIVDEKTGALVALIDWETSLSAPAPYWDIAVALHDLGIDEKEAFLRGYGISARSVHGALPFIRLFNVLNYAQPVERAVREGDRACMERYRMRLRGGLELYEA